MSSVLLLSFLKETCYILKLSTHFGKYDIGLYVNTTKCKKKKKTRKTTTTTTTATATATTTTTTEE